MLGRFVVIGSILMNENGPIGARQQSFSLKMLGYSWSSQLFSCKMDSFKVACGSSYAREWAQSSSSAGFFMLKNGPIRGHRQFCSCMGMRQFKLIGGFSCERMGPFNLIGSFSHMGSFVTSAVFFMHENGPIQCHRWVKLCKRIGPFLVIDRLLCARKWASSSSSAVFSMYRNGPIQGHRQFLSLNILGPIAVIGSFLHAWEWAHSRTSTVSLIEDTGPIRAHRQFSSCVRMGPFKVIGSFLREVNGPIRAHRQCSPCIGMGPFKVIDSFSH